MKLLLLVILAVCTKTVFSASYQAPVVHDTLATLTNSTVYADNPTAIVPSATTNSASLIYTYSAGATNTIDSPWVLPAKGGGRWLAYPIPYTWLSGVPAPFSFQVNGTPYTSANIRDTGVIEWTYSGGELYALIPHGVISTNFLSTGAITYLIDRANHTGTQAISTVSGLQSALDNKQATNNALTILAGGNGGSLTNLNGSNISTGTVAEARIDSALLRAATAASLYQPLAPYLTDLAGMTGLAGTMLYFDGSDLVPLGIGSAGQVLTVSGTTPTWAAAPGGTSVRVNGVTNSVWNFGSHFSSSGTNVNIADTAVTPGTYTLMTGTVNSRGQLTSASSGTVATNQIDATFYNWVNSKGSGGTNTTNYLSQTLAASLSSVTNLYTITTNEVTMLGTLASYSVTNRPANSISTGHVYKLRASGRLMAPASDYNGTFRFKLGTHVAEVSFNEANSYAPDGVGWTIEAYIQITSTGVSGTATTRGTLIWNINNYVDDALGANLRHFTGSGTLDTTGINALAFTYQSNPANPLSVICDGATIELIGAQVIGSGTTYSAGTNIVIDGNTISTVRSPSRRWASGTGAMISNSVSEVTWMSTTFPSLDDGDVVDWRLWMPFLVNSGTSPSLAIKIKVNGVTIHESSTAGQSSSPLWRVFRLSGWLQRAGSTVNLYAEPALAGGGTAPTTGIGSLVNAGSSGRTAGATNAAVTWGSDTNLLEVTATASSSTPTNIVLGPQWWIGR